MRARNPSIAEIGAFVRELRRDQALRQDELAAAASVGLRFLVELEAGKPTLQIAKVLQVLDALGCELSLLDSLGVRRLPLAAEVESELENPENPQADDPHPGRGNRRS